MKRPNVYVTRKIPQPAIELLQQHCDVEINPADRVLSKQELLTKVQEREAVICLLTDIIDAEVFEQAGRQCKIFANYAVGFNNIDIKAATARKVIITNTPGVLDDATADCAWALLFATARRIPSAEKFLRTGKFTGWGPLLYLGMDITGKTLGVVGAGRIGRNFAQKAKGFKMKILYTDTQPNQAFEEATGGEYTDKETLLRQADYVSLHIPLLPTTRHYIGAEELKIMKRTAILINTSRGPVVDETELVKALQQEQIWGAGLDVFENEPDVHPELLKLDNVVLVPHIASATIETRTNMGLIAVNNVIKVLNNQVPDNCVNPEVLELAIR